MHIFIDVLERVYLCLKFLHRGWKRDCVVVKAGENSNRDGYLCLKAGAEKSVLRRRARAGMPHALFGALAGGAAARLALTQAPGAARAPAA